MNTALAVAAALALVSADPMVPNGLAETPGMGYNTWNDFRCNLKATDIMSVADKMQSLGLRKLGYEYVNIDDCWAKGRYANGSVYPDNSTFPNGMKAVADYVHSKGFKFGIYTDRGTETCAGRPGSQDHEVVDANTYASWGVDYLKEDSCHASSDHDTAFQQYGKMRDALNKTGRPIYFSLCGWNSWYAPPGKTLGNSWRIAGDVNHWSNVINALNVNAPLAKYAGPGAWNDPDMLVGSDSQAAAHMTQDQSRAQFSLWSVMAAPLLIGSNILGLSSYDLETFTNTEVIAVDQDKLGKQGERLINTADTQVWGRELSTGAYAVVFLNTGATARTVTCDAACFKAMGLTSVTVRDLWQHKDIGSANGSFESGSLPATGGSQTVLFTPSSL